MVEVNKSLTGLKTCCSLVEWLKNSKVETNLEKDLIELFWFSLEHNKEICQNCQ